MSEIFLGVYSDILTTGCDVAPRGQNILELENYAFDMQPHDRFTSFKARNFNLSYLKTEFLWYLRANPKDGIIADHAQMWKEVCQPDGTYFSNYGQYWFGTTFSGLNWVVQTLLRDPDSRQAVIPMLSTKHCFEGNPDIVCTESISFRIRHGELNMSVNMRSQDAIWGMSNDIPCFHFLWEMVAAILSIPRGWYHHKVDSLHVYERHFRMLANLVEDGAKGLYYIDCPRITKKDAIQLPRYHVQHNDISKSEFYNWLTE